MWRQQRCRKRVFHALPAWRLLRTVLFRGAVMCLDPRPDRPFRTARAIRRSPSRDSLFHAPVLGRGLQLTVPAPVVRAPALWALENLAGDDELVARGWVVLSRES
jgi:hypothetical protein